MTRLRLFAIALFVLLSSNAWADLRTFDVDPQYGQEIFAALQNILNHNNQGRAQLLPSGQIVVNASPETLEQVEQVLKTISAKRAAATPRVALRYWGVLGAPAQPPGSKLIGSPPPAALNSVLSELRQLHDEVVFRVIGTAAVTTNSGQYGEVKGTTLDVEQTAYVQGDTLNVNISMGLSGELPLPPGFTVLPTGQSTTVPFGNLRLSTTLKRGEFVVLGENHVQAGDIEGPVFYIVHWEE